MYAYKTFVENDHRDEGQKILLAAAELFPDDVVGGMFLRQNLLLNLSSSSHKQFAKSTKSCGPESDQVLKMVSVIVESASSPDQRIKLFTLPYCDNHLQWKLCVVLLRCTKY